MFLTQIPPLKQFFLMPYITNDYKDPKEQKTVVAFSPKTNFRESTLNYHIEIDLPGLSKEDIKINLIDKELTIYGERKKRKGDYLKIESSFDKFQRQFTLSEDINIKNISAINKDGVLEIMLPKNKNCVNKKVIKIK